MSQSRQHERGGQISSNFQKMSVSDLNSRPQSHVSSSQGWASSAGSQQWRQPFPRFHGGSFGRPSSVPDTVNTAQPDLSQMGIGHQSMDTFDPQNRENMECKSHSPAFQFPSSSSKSGTPHFINPQYQTWSGDVSSEPLLTATTRRSISEYDALYMRQQQRQHARHSSRNVPMQFRAQKW